MFANKLILLLVSSLLVASFIGLGADFRSYEAERSFTVKVVADDQEFIDLKPVQPYAYMSQSGVIVFRFSDTNPNYPGEGGKGVSPNTTYAFDKIFNMSNHLWSNDSNYYDGVCVTIQSSISEVKLYSPADSSHSTPETAATTIDVYIPGGQEVSIGMVINTDGKSAPDTIQGQISFTVNAGQCT